jgi:hypothetical protein
MVLNEHIRVAMVPVLFGTLMSSLFAFSQDQRKCNYRYFQQHGERPGPIWWTRIMWPACVTLVLGLIMIGLVLVTYLSLWQANQSILPVGHYLANVTLGVFAAFAIGQFNSLFFRSPVFALAGAIVMGSAALMLGGVVDWGQSNPWIWLGPAPVAMILLSRWRVRDWLADKNSVRDLALPWVLLGMSTFGPLLAYWCCQSIGFAGK